MVSKTQSPQSSLNDDSLSAEADHYHTPSFPLHTNDNEGHFKSPDSSAISILSASGTLVSSDVRQHSPSTALPHPLSRTSTAHTLTMAQSLFDPEPFKAILNELNEYLEQFDALNDQILDAMTTYCENNLDMDLIPGSSSAGHLPGLMREHQSRDLEEHRWSAAQSIADLILSAWPRLCKTVTSTSPDPLTMQIQAQPQPPSHHMIKLNKQRTKIATQLKNGIVIFCSAQSLFQERAQLVLDIYQDPTELERDDRTRTLRSRHLNSLLSSTLSTAVGDQLARKLTEDQEKMALITESLQGVWLEIVFFLESSGPKGIVTHESFGRKLLRISKTKRQALKTLLKSW
ncbi:hypothetical protein BC939DRAFT_460877 [Gamsiella multidivaricata]|uniref:uncharacterized protein n=1 Tax=Gamsiella multidivaricata TaxID=101098 RepID=UPI00221EABF3|nr:uncharacterized protein BC939DRAFT_460877 [Gamsiella multidivaricata]KAG0356611.1 hypothetical protein BGZ54_000681 [Gamsiella multidivaricata]KAI7819144.1 hypothetical protein BC939DRAFT_460877 [Gamsiella multidivaricata]